MNTFFVIDDGSEFDTDNLNATFLDFKKGHFWQRDWVLSGADPNKLTKKYPICGIEQKVVGLDSVFPKSACYDYWIVMADVPDCSGCPDECNRTIDEVDRDLYESAIMFLKELKNYEEFVLVKDNESVNAWLTLAQVQYMLSEGDIDSYDVTCEDISMYVQDNKMDIRSTSIGSSDGARAISFMIKFCLCPQAGDFDYTFKSPVENSQTKCITC
jgi:hypothetical protein